MTKFVTLTV